MITLTTEIKSRCFKEYEKHKLFGIIREPVGKKRDEIREAFKKWLDENVMPKILNPDLKELGKKPYCKRSTSRYLITPSQFGLEVDYVGNPEFSKLRVSLKFEFLSDYKYSIPDHEFCIDITSEILKKCTPEMIEQVKYFLYEQAKSVYDYNFFGVGTFVRPNYGGYGYGLFDEIRTWGNLYSKSPEMFEKLYKMTEGKELSEEDENLDPEKKLLFKLKTTLGY